MLSQTIQNYIDMRRAGGFQFGCQAGFLHSFASFATAREERHVRASTAIEWAGQVAKTPQRAHRLWVVIRFARFARADDARHEVPLPVFGSETWPRRAPYILSQDEIARLMQVASDFGTHPMQGATYGTLIGLLACTGLRISEALRLRWSDITPDGLLIRNTKFRKNRLVVLHDSSRTALQRYHAQWRSTTSPDDSVFVSLRGTPLIRECVDRVFQELVNRAGLPRTPDVPRITPHALRHTFAVRALQTCPDGRDRVARHMVALSTYLGHVDAAATYWYLQATPELMRDISSRCEQFVEVAS
ncbi:tyrosine-type recombinase/integrase [Verminephrobacter eiseniae]|uniref:tyrosine-type recombinase/integrase n=1 Tax=Verminephrobacter eiseniae TaxID=364317 RepID=UPI0022375E7D|nr:tyrosine-type recombinase/integrase [Verminephrobacter eiseniae]